MRGRLWRGWLWTPRILLARLLRRTEIRIEDRLQETHRIRAGRPQTTARLWHREWWWVALRNVAILVAVVLIVLRIVFPLLNLLPFRNIGWLRSISEACSDSGNSCETLSGFLGVFTTAALSFVVFTVFVQFTVHNWYRRTGLREPKKLLQTATDIIDYVVGRDELCEVLIERIRDKRNRRPMILVGGVGSGKTAVMLKLTIELADRNILPVPIRLRDAHDKKKLNFEQMARDRFLELIDQQLFSGAEGDRIWRRLRWSNRIAILADGLEEAAGKGDGNTRDSVLREAIRAAADQRLPLIIASRPYDPLRGMNGILVALEPLGEGAALEYGRAREIGPSWALVAELVDAADVTESPMFMKVIRDLNDRAILPLAGRSATPDEPAKQVDRFAVRWQLLKAWEEALLNGAIGEDYAHTREEREAMLNVLSAFACIGFAKDSSEINLSDLLRKGEPAIDCIRDELMRRPNGGIDFKNSDELALVVSRGSELSIVDTMTNTIRFQHGVIHAYLGSRFLANQRLRDELRMASVAYGSNREFLIAVTLLSRGLEHEQQAVRSGEGNQNDRPFFDFQRVWRSDPVRDLVSFLRHQAKQEGTNRCWALELYAAALEIDTSAWRPEHLDLLREVENKWDRFEEHEIVPDRPMDEAKLRLVRRAGDAARLITARHRRLEARRPAATSPPPYITLFRLASRENSVRIRRAIAREIGLGGVDAVLSLQDVLCPRPVPADGGVNPWTDEEYAKRQDERGRNEEQLRGWIVPLLYLSSWHEETGHGLEKVRWQTEAERASHERRQRKIRWRGTVRWQNATRGQTRVLRQNEARRQSEVSRQGAACSHIQAVLRTWLSALSSYDPARPERAFPITSEIALAQGFRFAANMRRLPPHQRTDKRSILIEDAESALAHSRYWYSHIVLLQALTLLSLPDDPEENLPGRGRGSNPYEMIRFWMKIAGSQAPGWNQPRNDHPLLLEVGRLCVDTLLTRRPERFCWIEESETASRVGSCSADPAVRREQKQWIPDSMGWSVLVPRARRVLADIMLLLNLADRGDSLIERERRLTRSNQADLPPCLTNERRVLQPTRSHSADKPCEPGDTCLDDCRFRLCPLPAKGERLPHSMDQNFCAHQADLAARWYAFKARAPWQSGSRRMLKKFWREMSERELPGWRQ